MENREISDLLDEIADMLSIEETGTSRFEVRAYRNAALTLSTLQEPIEEVYRKGGTKAIMELPGIGPGIASKIEEFIRTGRMAKYEALKKRYPINFKELLQLEGMGAKKAVMLYRDLKVKDLEGLKKAIARHEIAKLPGFGERSEEVLSNSIAALQGSKGRVLLGDSLPEAESIVRELEGSGMVEKAVIAGSVRRMRETSGDIDILAISKQGEKAMDFFSRMKDVKSVVIKGPTKTTVWLRMGITCDLRVLKPESFGAAQQYFIGSKAHNIELRKIAIRKRYKLNEYGLFDSNGRIVESVDERVIYERLGMQYVEPEMRENRGEIKLAMEHKLPKLVELSSLKGDLHTHSRDSDGINSIEEMAAEARKLGMGYIASTNHTKGLRVANGMDEGAFLALMKRIDRLNDSDKGFRVLKGAEVDILKDGSLDLDARVLKQMECVVASVHSSFRMNERDMTARVIRAVESGMVHILGHPTGRLIGSREAYPVDLGKVAQACEDNNVALEVNSWPNRLDLNDTNILLASKYKVSFAIDSDAHSTAHYQTLRYGVGTARRGWLTPKRVINTLQTEKLMKLLAR